MRNAESNPKAIHLDELHIENYRNLPKVSLEDLSLVNVLVGKNGVGKTAVLEAVDLLGNVAPHRHTGLGEWRGIASSSLRFHTAFHKLDLSRKIKINTADIFLEISSLDYSDANEIIRGHKLSESDDSAITDWDGIHGVSHIYSRRNETDVKWDLALHGNHFHSENPDEIPNALGAFFMHTRRAHSVKETAKMISEVQRGAGDIEEWLQDSLKNIDKSCKRIRVDYAENVLDVVVDTYWGNSIPIAVMGDGFNRLALMFTGGFSSQSNLLLIDDVDSGIHYEMMSDVWKALLSFARDNGKQIFCTTHDEDMLLSTLDAFSDNKDALRIYRISNRDGESHAQKYDYELFRDTKIAGFPVR